MALAVDFRSRFWYFLALLLTYSWVSSALGFAYTSAFDVPATAQRLIPVIVTPQLLLSGFLVTKNYLPKWFRWLVWLQPLSFSFRLGLHEEFALCQDLSERDLNLLHCSKSLQTAFKRFREDGLGVFYDDESILTLMQAGQYKGTQAILEYLAYFSEEEHPLSMLWNFCSVSSV